MRWQKLGQIFEFDKSPFKSCYVSHAQSPQAVVFKDHVRIYFSTRKIDKDGKFLSYVQYVDYDLDIKKIINYSQHEVIPLGNLGCFNEHGIFPFSPLIVDDKIYGYTTGWTRRKSVDVDSGIGLSISTDDGITFEKLGDGPVLTSSLHEPFLVCDGFVRKFGNKFYMFYIAGKKWSEPDRGHVAERVYKIRYAVSDDGLNWHRADKWIIPDKVDENECQALPTVIKIDKRYHIYFCYRHMTGFRTEKGKGYRLGYAYSDDLTNWARDDKNAGIDLSETGWDSEMMCYPHIFRCKNQVYLIYNGNSFGKGGFGLAKLISE